MMSRAFLAVLLPVTASALLGACGDDTQVDEGSDSTAAASESGTAAPETTADTSTSEETPTTTGDDSTTGDDTSDEGTGGVSDSEGTTGEPSPYDGEPLPPADDGEWIWVDFPEAKCRDGSTTGIGVRYGSGTGLAIFFEGGGACFNLLTCNANPSRFGALEFNGFGGNEGLYDVGNPDNPLADWSFVYIPYCTGDVHAGARADGTLPDYPVPQQFVGYLNVGHFLQRIVPTFLPDVDHVLVTGVSAGGFGAAFNYDRIAEAFPKDKVTLLDDSGPPMSDEFMATCLQKKWREAWNLDETMPADCNNCFPEDGGGIVNLGVYLGEKYKDQHLGLISSLGDQTIRFFFGFGNDDCNALIPGTSEQKFTEGLYDLRDNWMNEPAGVWGTFFLAGTQHTWIAGGSYATATSGDGVRLIDWVRDLLDGKVANVEP